MISTQSVFGFFAVAAGYALTMSTSGMIVKHLVGEEPAPATGATVSRGKHHIGAIIGKCENFLVITFILADAITALGLIFAARSIVCSEKIRIELHTISAEPSSTSAILYLRGSSFVLSLTC